MLFQTHFIVTTILLKFLNLQGIDIFLAYFFGVLIDIDHILHPDGFRYFLGEPIGKKDWTFKDQKRTHTFIHEPIFVLPVFLFSLVIRNNVPLIFWFSHFLLDHVLLKSKKQPFWPFNKKEYIYGLILSGTKIEWVISSLLVFILVTTMILRW